MAARGTGRTAFFAALDGTVKYESLAKWNSERQESAGPDIAGPASLDLADAGPITAFLGQPACLP